jgi:hypothetical protein
VGQLLQSNGREVMAGQPSRSPKSQLLPKPATRPRSPTRRRAPAWSAREIGPADPELADASAVLDLQRNAGNRATTEWLSSATVGRVAAAPAIQRDVPSKVGAPKWTVGRPSSVKAIDVTLGALVKKMADLPGAAEEHKKLITAVLGAIGTFRASKDATGKWAAAVAAVEAEVKAKEGEVDAKLAVKEEGKTRYASFATLEPDLAQFAKRTQFADPALFEGELTPIKAALSGPRADGGGLSPEAIKSMTEAQAGEIEGEKTTEGKEITFAGLTVDDVRTFMEKHTNALTKKTMYPELANVTQPSGDPDAVVVSSVDVGGVAMQVEHNASDVNYAERLQLIKDAVAKVSAAGVKVPPMKVHLPKYGRGLKLKASDTAPGGISCEIPEKSSRAVFIPPDFMHLSSEVIGTPDMTKVTNPTSGQEEYKFSSTGFDPSGVASIVHEIGHAVHFTSAPGKYHGLWGTSFGGKAPSGKLTSAVANSEVSQYGNKPREFVAEVFLGLVYGKTYSEDVMTMYRAFGGVIPTSVTVAAAAKAL